MSPKRLKYLIIVYDKKINFVSPVQNNPQLISYLITKENDEAVWGIKYSQVVIASALSLSLQMFV